MKNLALLLISVAATALAASTAPPPATAFPRPILILGGTLIDGAGATPRHNDGLLIQKGRIAIGS